MSKKLLLISVFIFCSIFISHDVFAYDDKTTHPALTNNSADFYNIYFEKKLTSQEKEWLIAGSIKEDTPPRWINHFYDPVYKEGWTGEHGPAEVSQELLQKFSDVFLSPKSAVSTPNWAHNQELQAKYYLYEGNRTWERAIYEYVKNKNKEEAYRCLGHVLHLIQDMAVSEHTRNDTHTGDSPYENYASQFNRSKFYIAEDLKNQNYQPINLNSLDDYFENLSSYSNNYFFSKDTINDPKYDKPKIIEENENWGYGIDKNNTQFAIVKIRYEKLNNYDVIKVYEIKDEKFIVLNAYWIRLSREAILASAGLINLFQQEVARLENNPDDIPQLYQPSPITALGNIFISPFGEFSRLASAYNKTKTFLASVIGSIFNLAQNEPVILEPKSDIGSDNLLNTYTPTPALTPIPTPTLPPTTSSPIPNPSPSPVITPVITKENPTPGVIEPKFSVSSLPYPGFGGGGGGGTQNSNTENQELEPSSTPTPTPDTIPPDISFSISECGQSFSSDGCLLATTTLNILWSSAATDLDYFEFNNNGVVSTTTSTSTTVVILGDSTNTFTIRAKDTAGNWSETKSTTVVVSSMPVVINEVAWSGTAASPYDEWIELYNKTDYEINLDGWALYTSNNKPYIQLSNKISPRGYFLLERTDDYTISDIIPADLIYGNNHGNWALNNNGETLILSYASTTIDRTATMPNGRWPAGDENGITMERRDPDSSGNDINNWASNNRIIKNGKSAGPHFFDIDGTPKARNSANYLIAKGQPYISENIILTKENSPYVVNNTIQVFTASSTLTIKPGVVIKFYNDSGFNVYGKIIAQGIVKEQIVFENLRENEYWFGINIFNDGSIFDHTIFRQGGKWYTGTGQSMANLSVQNASATITNSIFEYSQVYGLKLVDSNSIVSNNIFRSNNRGNDPAGSNSALFVSGGSPAISNNTFSSNKIGLTLYDSSAAVDGNSFESNTIAAINSSGRLPAFTDNSGSANGINGIVIRGNLTTENGQAALKKNFLPYVIKTYSASVVAGSDLMIEKDVVMKSDKSLNIDGNLFINGEDPEDIIFTSLYDDSIGGDTNNDATSTSATPGQFPGIYVSSTGSLKAKGFTVRYAGSNAYMGQNSGGIMIDGALVNISNALFDNNYPHGIYAVSSPNIIIENVSFENHNYIGSWGIKAGLAVYNSTTTLSNVSFKNNLLGIASDTISTFVANAVEFIDNITDTSPADLW